VVKVWRRTETGEAPRRRGLAEVRGCESVPRTKADGREPGPPPRVVCAAGWQYRECLSEEQRSWRRGPQRGSRVGVGRGCIARRIEPDFHHGLVSAVN